MNKLKTGKTFSKGWQAVEKLYLVFSPVNRSAEIPDISMMDLMVPTGMSLPL